MSASDIEKGTNWRSGLTDELENASIGIICLTLENLDSPWIHFEAGALSKQQQNTRVCTFLYEVDPLDVGDPLSQFQTTKAQKEDVRKLIQAINNLRGEERLPDSEVTESFDVWWPKLEERLNSIPASLELQKPKREIREILEEILLFVRAQPRYGGIDLSGLRPRLWSTLDSTPEDNELLLEHYEYVGKFNNGEYSAYLTQLKHDKYFAETTVEALKVVGARMLPSAEFLENLKKRSQKKGTVDEHTDS